VVAELNAMTWSASCPANSEPHTSSFV
jgi:hypothetical protein